MHVIFISNSTGKASAKVRAVLDAYATRIGDAAWATPITQEALDEVRRALKKGISRHTSVACYRNKGRGSMALYWIVGNRNHYDSRGAFAPESRSRKKEFAMSYRHAALVAGIAGYGHDLGKSNGQFQHKIGNSAEKSEGQSDGIRHEWISAWVFRALTPDSTSLPEVMALWDENSMADAIKNEWMPIQDRIASAEDAIATLIATHHHAFGYGESKNIRKLAKVSRNVIHVKEITDEQKRRLRALGVTPGDPRWTAHGETIRSELARLNGIHDDDPDYWHGVTMVARAALLLADHEVSASDQTHESKKTRPTLYANTAKVNGKSILNQDLLWHLVNVGKTAKRNVAMFANDDLPSLPLDTAERIMGRSPISRFQWQDVACDAMPQGPALVFNVASTGAGKTRANVKLICALRGGKGVRISSAFNLRALTLQTYDAYSEEMALEPSSECACLIGDPVVREIHNSLRDDESTEKVLGDLDISGSETRHEVVGLDALPIPEWLGREVDRISGKSQERATVLKKMLAAPVLVSTVDFLNAAGDMTKPNADHAHALLRMAHSDLILDELDSYDPESMVAVIRLVHVAAFFGRNVVISSATLSPSLAEFAHRTYKAGIRAHRAMFGQHITAKVAMVSDLAAPMHIDGDADSFTASYQEYLSSMTPIDGARTKVFRIAENGDSVDGFHDAVRDSVKCLHEAHGWDMEGTKVSVGLVRVANISTCLEVAERLVTSDPRIHVVTYHAREPLLRRTFKERQFDRILRRKTDSEALAASMREHLKKFELPADAIFVVVATPVEEVGRDHDFDWGIIEPSSMHSIIQTAGRVNRHRLKDVDAANVVVLNRCYRDVSKKSKRGCVFILPGNEIADEASGTSHPNHAMTALLGLDVGDEAPLDIRMMFGSNRTKFAEYDEGSIHTRLETVVARHIEPNGNLAWFGKWFGKAYPLREQSSTETCAVLPEGRRKVRFRKYGYVAQPLKNGILVGTWKWWDAPADDEGDCFDTPEQAWLSPTIHEVIEHLSGKLGREIREDDMSFQIYSKNPEREAARDGSRILRMDWRGVVVAV